MSLMDFIVYVLIFVVLIYNSFILTYSLTFFFRLYKSEKFNLQDGTVYHIINCSSHTNDKKVTADKEK